MISDESRALSWLCEEEDLNLHSFRNQNLNLARLPVSPSSRGTTPTLQPLAGFSSPAPAQPCCSPGGACAPPLNARSLNGMTIAVRSTHADPRGGSFVVAVVGMLLLACSSSGKPASGSSDGSGGAGHSGGAGGTGGSGGAGGQGRADAGLTDAASGGAGPASGGVGGAATTADQVCRSVLGALCDRAAICSGTPPEIPPSARRPATTSARPVRTTSSTRRRPAQSPPSRAASPR